VLEKSVKQLYC